MIISISNQKSVNDILKTALIPKQESEVTFSPYSVSMHLNQVHRAAADLKQNKMMIEAIIQTAYITK